MLMVGTMIILMEHTIIIIRAVQILILVIVLALMTGLQMGACVVQEVLGGVFDHIDRTCPPVLSDLAPRTPTQMDAHWQADQEGAP